MQYSLLNALSAALENVFDYKSYQNQTDSCKAMFRNKLAVALFDTAKTLNTNVMVETIYGFPFWEKSRVKTHSVLGLGYNSCKDSGIATEVTSISFPKEFIDQKFLEDELRKVKNVENFKEKHPFSFNI